MTLYLLDTNAVSDIIKGHPTLTKRLIAQPISTIYISAITEGELVAPDKLLKRNVYAG